MKRPARTARFVGTAVLVLGLATGVAFGVGESSSSAVIDPATLELPESAPRSPWVRADGSVDAARVPQGPRAESWVRADGSVDCSRAPATMGVATFDGGIMLDAKGREVRVPLLACGSDESPELMRAWAVRIGQMQAADAQTRGVTPER